MVQVVQVPRQVYIEPSGRPHPLVRELVEAPPEGYRFVTKEGAWERSVSGLYRTPLMPWVLEPLSRHVLPLGLLKPYVEAPFRRPPPGTALTLAYNHLVFRKEPWVPLVEWVTMLAGFNIRYVRRYRGLLRRRLASRDCRAIITWSACAKRSLLMNLESPDLEPKVHVLPLVVRPKSASRASDPTKPVRLLFVGSGTVPRNFDLKGGKEVVEAFLQLKRTYPDLELTVRSDVPPNYRQICSEVPGVRLLERWLTQEEMEREFLSADIFVYPSYTSHDVVVLDAMSYGLPVITTAVADRPEVVEDGITGLLVPQPSQVPSYQDTYLVPQRQTPFRRRFELAISQVQPQMVADLVARLRTLIEDPALRQRVGGAARREIEEGRLSIAQRNRVLKAVLDHATAGPP